MLAAASDHARLFCSLLERRARFGQDASGERLRGLALGRHKARWSVGRFFGMTSKGESQAFIDADALEKQRNMTGGQIRQ